MVKLLHTRLKIADLTVDTKTTHKMVINAILDDLYISSENLNMQELTEDKLIEVMSLINSEYLKMKQGEGNTAL